jgi:hypothetical protein
MQFEQNRELLQSELDQLRWEKKELEESFSLLEQQLKQHQERSDSENNRLLESQRLQQKELKRRIQILEQKKRRLSEIDHQLENTENEQLRDVHKLRDKLCNAATAGSPTDYGCLSRESDAEPLDDSEGEGTELDENSPDYQQLFYQLQHELDVSATEKKKMLITHTEALNKVQSEAEEEKQRLFSSESEQNKTILRLRKELHSSQMALEQYKNDAHSLEVQLQMLQQEIEVKDREMQLLQGRQQRKILPILPSQTVENKELTRIKEEKKSLQETINAKVAEFERHLQNEAIHRKKCEALLEERQREHQEELTKTKEGAERKVLTFQKMLSSEQTANRIRSEIQVERAEKQVKAGHFSIRNLEEKVELAEKQCKILLLELSQQKDEAQKQERQITELQDIQRKVREELFVMAREKRELEIHLEHQLHTQIAQVQSELEQKVVEEVAMEDIDLPLEGLSLTMPLRPSSRQSYQYNHEEIVVQMKEQLDNLQMSLLQQHDSFSKTNELTLVQQLLQTNLALKQSLEQEQKDRQREFAALNSEIETLQRRMKNDRLKVATFNNNVSEKLEKALKSLQQRTEACICTSLAKVEAASAAISHLIQGANAREEVCTKASVSGLKQETHEQEINSTCSDKEMTEEDQEVEHQLHVDETETHELKKHLQETPAQSSLLQAYQTARVHEYAVMKPPEITVRQKRILPEYFSKEKSNKVEQGNEEHSTVLLLERERKAVQQQMEMSNQIHMKLMAEISSLKDKVCVKEKEIETLQRKLQQKLVNECVVTPQIQATPRKSTSEAVRTLGVDYRCLQVQHAAEVEQLKEELEKSMTKSVELEQQVFALREAVQVQEAELRASMTIREGERRESERHTKKSQTIFAKEELSSARMEVDSLKMQLHAVCKQLFSVPTKSDSVDYCDLAQRAQYEIKQLLRQLSEEKILHHEAEIQMEKSQNEWQVQESQWLMEHEEEVRALKQRNSHLLQMLEDTRSQYQEYIEDKERENAEILQDLITKQASLENELEQRTKQDSFQAEDKDEEREALLDIIQQLCSQWERPFDYVG